MEAAQEQSREQKALREARDRMAAIAERQEQQADAQESIERATDASFYALSCSKLIFSTGDVRCECRNEAGQLIHKGYACIQHMQDTIGAFGGTTAKADNVAYLNARDSQSQNKPAS